MATCANGHTVPAGFRFCSECGLVVQDDGDQFTADQSLPMPPPPPSGNGKRWAIMGGAAAAGLVVLVVLLVVLLRGGSVEPLTESAAQNALLTSSTLPLDMVVNSEPSELDADTPFDPDTTAACTTVKGVSRLADIDPTMPLGSPAFPREARDINVFVGADFKDPTDGVVATFEERIMVFPTTEDATAYLAAVGAALGDCPGDEIVVPADTLVFVSTDEYRNVEVSDTQISWNSDSTGSLDSDLDLLDFTFRSTTGNRLVQSGPNVLVTDWYQDEDTAMSTSEFEAAADAAVESFLAATG